MFERQSSDIDCTSRVEVLRVGLATEDSKEFIPAAA
jgi:hypothetical protein